MFLMQLIISSFKYSLGYRRVHAEIVMVVSDFFKRNNVSFVDKEDLINNLADYINNRDFENMIDDEGNDISSSSAREKALDKINLFKKNNTFEFK